MINDTLNRLGLSDKEIAVYLSLIKLRPSAVRALASKSQVNRGTTYDILKKMVQKLLGLILPKLLLESAKNALLSMD